MPANVFTTPIDADIAAEAERHHHNPEAILEVFRELQIKRGGLPRETIVDVARALHVPASHAYGVASFYTMLSREPHVGHTIRACDGPVCARHDAARHGAAPVRAALDALASEYRSGACCAPVALACAIALRRRWWTMSSAGRSIPIGPPKFDRVGAGRRRTIPSRARAKCA